MTFQMGAVTVDDRFARFGSKSFAINKITSVDVRSATKEGSGAYVFWGLVTLCLVVWAITKVTVGPAVFALVSAALAWHSWQKRHPTTTYRLFLVTSASEAQAFETTDYEELGALRDAIEGAMARSA